MNITKEQIKEWLLSRSTPENEILPLMVDVIHDCARDLSPRWISFEDRLPEVGVRVLIFTTQPLEAVMYRNNRFNRFGMDIDYATHWMPLPEPPK